MTLPEGWPRVDPHDDGIRPAGRPDECFYCHQRVGKLHGPQCVIVTKVVELQVKALLDGRVATGMWEITEPHSWDGAKMERYFNQSSWCKSNFLGSRTRDGRSDRGIVTWLNGDDPWVELEEFYQNGDCLCKRLSFKFVRVVDNTPRREIRHEELN